MSLGFFSIRFQLNLRWGFFCISLILSVEREADLSYNFVAVFFIFSIFIRGFFFSFSCASVAIEELILLGCCTGNRGCGGLWIWGDYLKLISIFLLLFCLLIYLGICFGMIYGCTAFFLCAIVRGYLPAFGIYRGSVF
jgi:hypothetical protein